jgi:hypothetical protein
MAIKLSTGLRNGMMDSNDFKTALDGGLLYIYDGTPPADADAANAGNTLLCTVSLNSTGSGINFDTAAASGVLSKAPGETWSGVNAATGTASFFRFTESGGTPAGASTTEQRIQGTIGVAGADLNLSSVGLTISATQTIDFFNVTMPASA